MQRVLVVGIDTIVGGNLATALSPQHSVVGFSSKKNVNIAGCRVHDSLPQSPEDIRRELAMHSPDLVVVCGPAALSIWSLDNPESLAAASMENAVAWAREVAGTKAHLIVISSDAVFHGPWMFHEEDCAGVCESATAVAIHKMEAQVRRSCPSALIVRTNVFGWNPLPAEGWLESLIEQISNETPLRVPSGNYATPIEASRLAQVLIQLWDRGLEGLYHVGGSERVNFVHFAHRLAQEFQLPRPKFQRNQPTEAAGGFGQGETSLNSGKVRRAVGTPLPMLSESLKQLREQTENGDRNLLHAESLEMATHAA